MTDGKIRASLEMNRALFDGRGDDLLDAFVALVEQGGITISEASAERLLDAVRSAALLPSEVVT